MSAQLGLKLGFGHPEAAEPPGESSVAFVSIDQMIELSQMNSCSLLRSGKCPEVPTFTDSDGAVCRVVLSGHGHWRRPARNLKGWEGIPFLIGARQAMPVAEQNASYRVGGVPCRDSSHRRLFAPGWWYHSNPIIEKILLESLLEYRARGLHVRES